MVSTRYSQHLNLQRFGLQWFLVCRMHLLFQPTSQECNSQGSFCGPQNLESEFDLCFVSTNKQIRALHQLTLFPTFFGSDSALFISWFIHQKCIDVSVAGIVCMCILHLVYIFGVRQKQHGSFGLVLYDVYLSMFGNCLRIWQENTPKEGVQLTMGTIPAIPEVAVLFPEAAPSLRELLSEEGRETLGNDRWHVDRWLALCRLWKHSQTSNRISLFSLKILEVNCRERPATEPSQRLYHSLQSKKSWMKSVIRWSLGSATIRT